jgi:hypothetical protein
MDMDLNQEEEMFCFSKDVFPRHSSKEQNEDERMKYE